MPYPCVSKKNDVSVMARLWLGYGSVMARLRHFQIFAFSHLVIVKIKKRKRKSALKEK